MILNVVGIMHLKPDLNVGKYLPIYLSSAAAASRQQNAPNKKPQASGSKPVHSNNPKQTVLTGIGRELNDARWGRTQNNSVSPAAVQGGMVSLFKISTFHCPIDHVCSFHPWFAPRNRYDNLCR
jgi:hypothetical protein